MWAEDGVYRVDEETKEEELVAILRPIPSHKKVSNKVWVDGDMIRENVTFSATDYDGRHYIKIKAVND